MLSFVFSATATPAEEVKRSEIENEKDRNI